MRRLAIAVFPLLLSGCGLFDDASWTSSDLPPDPAASSTLPPAQIAPARVTQRQQSVPLDYPDCRNVASERSHDAAEGGYDDVTQKYVYDHVYADCTAWQARDVR
jgi:hypothetical protein